LNANKQIIPKEVVIRINYSKRNQPITLSRLLPLIIAVGKYFATFFTTARIYKGYRTRMTKKKERKNVTLILFFLKIHVENEKKKEKKRKEKKNPLTVSDMKAQSGLSTICERVPS